MKMIRTTTITDVPYFDNITIRPSERSEGNLCVQLSDGAGTLSLSIGEITQLRNALSAAIAEAKALAASLAGSVQPFMVRQELNGTEDLPIGTVIEDRDGTSWTLDCKGWTSPGGMFRPIPLRDVHSGLAPLHILSLPGGES